MTIVVTTPTGHVGSRVVRLLIQAGVRPTVLVRDTERLGEETRRRVGVRQGDLTDGAFVRAAVAGARTVLWVDPTPHTSPEPVEASLRTAEALARAAEAGEVDRIVLLSSVGAEKRGGAGHIDGLARIEQRFEATGVDVLHLRSGYFFTNLLASADSLACGVLTTTTDPDRPLPWVDPRDIGDVAAARLLNDDWRGQGVQAVHGPEDLSYRQVAAILSEVLDRDIRVHHMSDDDLRAVLRSAGLRSGAVEGIVGMAAGTRDLVPEQPRDVVTTTPSPLAAWAYAHLRPVLH
ncbi:NmrA family NAD(P)-binding protein [Nocardiopsis protaetiae]|uniref:NmrA family NAD(P)-binding protein n=1 Tax=Nocardiopsis protaetiae TaxID=3382270 RepID=UPI00387B9252